MKLSLFLLSKNRIFEIQANLMNESTQSIAPVDGSALSAQNPPSADMFFERMLWYLNNVNSPGISAVVLAEVRAQLAENLAELLAYGKAGRSTVQRFMALEFEVLKVNAAETEKPSWWKRILTAAVMSLPERRNVFDAFAPVRSWYDGEGRCNDFAAMLSAAVEDLQNDRAEVLKLRAQLHVPGHETMTYKDFFGIMESDLRARLDLLTNAIKEHRSQRLDDRCWLDDQKLYKVLGDGDLGDNSTPPMDKMLANCKRFLERRCTPGAQWQSYQELEEEIEQLKLKVHGLLMLTCLWQASFGKYESWAANKASPRHWPPEVLKDYRSCAKHTDNVLKELKVNGTTDKTNQ